MRRQAAFLPDWPGDGNCDCYLRMGENNSGYALVFNSNPEEAEAVIPLDNSTGLDSEQAYRIDVEFPDHADNTVASLVKGTIRFKMPPRSVYLLALEQGHSKELDGNDTSEQ